MKTPLIICLGIVLIVNTSCSESASRPTVTPAVSETSAADRDIHSELIYGGFARSASPLTLSGGLTANSDGATITTVGFDITLAAGVDSLNFDAAAADGTAITFIDDSVVKNHVAYTATSITGNADKLLEPGELMHVSIDLSGIGATVAANDSFSLEVRPANGSYLVMQRTAPPILRAVNNLN